MSRVEATIWCVAIALGTLGAIADLLLAQWFEALSQAAFTLLAFLYFTTRRELESLREKADQ